MKDRGIILHIYMYLSTRALGGCKLPLEREGPDCSFQHEFRRAQQMKARGNKEQDHEPLPALWESEPDWNLRTVDGMGRGSFASSLKPSS